MRGMNNPAKECPMHEKIRQCLEVALRNGETLEEFRARFDALCLNKTAATRLPADWFACGESSKC